MKRTTATIVCLLTIWMVSAFASGKTKSSKEVPKAIVTPNAASNIALGAMNTSAGRSQGLGTPPSSGTTRTTTSHTETVEINIRNISTIAQSITVQWFWVGRYEKSRNWFRTGDGEKTIDIEPNKSQIVLANTVIEGHDTKGKNEHYKSGGNLLGWVVIAYNTKHEIQAIKTSDPFLEGFVASPPAKQRRSP